MCSTHKKEGEFLRKKYIAIYALTREYLDCVPMIKFPVIKQIWQKHSGTERIKAHGTSKKLYIISLYLKKVEEKLLFVVINKHHGVHIRVCTCIYGEIMCKRLALMRFFSLCSLSFVLSNRPTMGAYDDIRCVYVGAHSWKWLRATVYHITWY